jgi:hypothetical protein
MAIQYNDDGSMTIKLDDDFNLPQSLLGNPKLSKEIDDLLFAKDTKGVKPGIDDMSKPFNPIKTEGIDLESVEKDIDKFLGKDRDLYDILGIGALRDNPILDSIFYGLGGSKEDVQGGVAGFGESGDKYIKSIIKEVQAEKNKDTSAPGKGDTKVTMEDFIKKANEKDKEQFEQIKKALGIGDEFREVEIEEAPGANLEENIISKTPVKGEKPDGPDIVLKKKPEPPSKIDRIMNKLLAKDDFLLDLGSRLMKGEGLFPGAIEAAKTQKEADKSAAATALSNILTQATIKEKLKGTDLMREADAYALKQSGGKPGSDAYNKAYTQYMDYIAEGDRDLMSPSDLVMLSMFGSQTGDENLQRYTDALLNQYLKQSGITPDATGGAGGTGGPAIIDSFNTGA